jgi:exosortase H (IPTLxxWG-CTERM-specific)
MPKALRPTRFVTVFAICFLLGFALLVTPPVHVLDAGFSSVLVRISHALIAWCGGHASIDGAVLRSSTGDFGVEMKDGCNGINVMILLWSAILAFPASWSMRGMGLLAGSLIIQALNMLRFVSLFYTGQYSMSWFDFAHGYLWESMLILDTLVVFWVWADRVSRSRARPNGNL